MHNTTLTGCHIRLRPMRPDDATTLVEAASDGKLWNLNFTVVPSAETVEAYLARALEGDATGHMMCFVTEDLASGKAIGSTRFWQIDTPNRTLEIGHTWIGASWQRTVVNTEAKYLMLKHAFEEMQCLRVQFTTDEINEKSRAAILRLGAMQEGIIRKERIMPDGRQRNSVRFSIIDDEWPQVKERLAARLAQV